MDQIMLTAYWILEIGVFVSVALALFVALFGRNAQLARTALIFAGGEVAFYLVKTYSGFDHNGRQALLMVINILCCVIVMWHPARLIQCWFGACYAASAVLLGFYIWIFPGSVSAYNTMWLAVTTFALVQVALLLGWSGVRSGNAYRNASDLVSGLVRGARLGNNK